MSGLYGRLDVAWIYYILAPGTIILHSLFWMVVMASCTMSSTSFWQVGMSLIRLMT